MANCFSRVEFVKRSLGKNACLKSSYISRGRVDFEGTKFQEKQVFNFSHMEKPVFADVLLPEHASKELKDPEKLWNLCEAFENRKDSQPAFEMVLALPDDKIITVEDRKHLLLTFVEQHFIKEGFAAEVAIHQPHNRGEKDHNWHAHVLVTGRKIDETGNTLESTKPREFFSRLSNTKWYLKWTQHQNEYFQEKGLSLRVDPIGVIPEKHLGPVRMRGKAMSLVVENESLKELNQIKCSDPRVVLEKIIETKSVFVPKDVDDFLHRNVSPEKVSQVRKEFWKLPEIVELLDPQTAKKTHKYTTREVVKEEEQLLRIADRIESKDRISSPGKIDPFLTNLSDEQKKAFSSLIEGQRLVCIDGHAGTGKSYLLSSLKEYYQSQNLNVRALGPDNATAKVLQSKGFKNSQNIYKFLFTLKHGKIKPSKSNEVWIVDESSKLGNQPLLEFLKFADKYNAQVVFSGSASQLGSVSRGGFFEVFCNRYGSQTLKEIQRQNTQEQRAMALNFAEGKAWSGLNTLLANQSVHWNQTKEESFGKLIQEWAEDAKFFPTSSRLILARSNADVKILNEMAREIRRQTGELGEKEYSCETSLGKVFVSQGDLLEFRANDSNLGITNGTVGTLTHAAEEKFTVSIENPLGKQKIISFNPQEFSSYQLGYASTVFRSQGETVDRAYVAYSPGYTKKELYVAMTRHAKDVALFVDKERVPTIARLKYFLGKQQKEHTTLDFLTEDKIDTLAQKQENDQKIEHLLSSHSLTDRMKGRGLSLFGNLKNSLEGFRTTYSDRLPNTQFFNPNIPEPAKGSVVEFSREDLDPTETTNIPEPKSITPDRGENQRDSLFTQYQESCNRASTFRLVALSESESQGKPVEQVPHFKIWQQVCGERNKKAFDFLSANSNETLSNLLGEKKLTILKEHVERHLEFLEKSREIPITKKEIEQKLNDNIDVLLYRLFPDGPTRKECSRLRFGRKGSLCVTVSGSKQGTYFNFEEDRGGGLIELISERNNLTRQEAFDWAKDFLKISETIKVPKSYQIHHLRQEIKEGNWVSQKPPSTVQQYSSPALPPYLKEFEEQARYAYRDKNGDLLFYTLRLSDKNDPSGKAILPLSYGYWKNRPNQNRWALKHYANSDRPLYGLHLLYKNHNKPVLIVEGEKSADAAKQYFPDHVCISWSGGSGAVSKTNWSPLMGKEVLIWPDNDKAGYKASEKISSELRKQGVKSLKVVQENQLAKFPEKWDLADPLPEKLSQNEIKDIAILSKSKAIDPQRLLVEIGAKDYENPLEMAKANEVLWRVYERMEGELSAKHGGRENLIELDILSESAKVLRSKHSIMETLSQEFGIKDKLSERICHQALLQVAQNGKEATKSDLERWKNQIKESKWIGSLEKDLEKSGCDPKTQELAITRTLSQSIQNPRLSEKELKENTHIFVESLKESQKIQRELQKQLDKSLEKSNSLEFSL